jgi:uncharacterized protein (TIGR02001 family)
MKPTLTPLVLALGLLGLSTAAHGQEPAPAAPAVTANFTLATQYISRGFEQTWGRPALQGGFDYADPSGFAIGTWMSNVSSKMIEGGTLEWDLYAGYYGSAGELGYSAVVLYYLYPGAEIAAYKVKYDYGELSLGISYKMFTAKYNTTYTKDYFGFTDARGTGYLDLGAAFDLGSGFGLQLHYGAGKVRNWSDYDWKDYKISVSKELGAGFTGSAALTRGTGASAVYKNYPATTPNSAGVIDTSDPLGTNLILSITKAF